MYRLCYLPARALHGYRDRLYILSAAMSTVQTEVSNGIATITLQRPKTLNAITMEGRTLYLCALTQLKGCYRLRYVCCGSQRN